MSALRPLLFLVLLAEACSAPRRASLGVECELNSECDTPLVCRLGACRNECATSGDCTRGLSCLLDADGLGACQLPEETDCALASECPANLVCRFGECANACETDRDCPGGSRCEMDTEGLACIDRSEQPCSSDGECEPDVTFRRCLSGRCRTECFTDRDCRNDFTCRNGVCFPPLREEDGGGLDGALDGGLDGALDGGLDGGARLDAGGDAGVPGTTCTGGPLSDVTTFDHNRLLGCAVVDGTTSGLTPGVYCWGQSNEDAFVGLPPRPGTMNPPCARRLDFLGTTVWDEIVLSGSAGCVRQGGAVQCWGADDVGQIPDGMAGVAVPALFTVAFAGGAADRLFRGEAGGIFARDTSAGVLLWGTSMAGNLGDGTSGTTRHDSPLLLPFVTGLVEDLASNSRATCATQVADVACSPAVFAGTGPTLPGTRALSAGAQHFCAADAGTVHCWGTNAHGELGTGDTLPTGARELVGGLPAMAVRDVDLGGDSSCALLADQSVWCWGAPGPIDPSRATLDYVLTPIRVMTGRTLLRVDNQVSCALGTDRQVLCVGTSSSAFLGYGTGPTPTIPVVVQL
jgi:hypothetical protein